MWTDISRGISRWPANARGCRPLGSSGKRPLKPHLDGPAHPLDGCRAGRASPQAQWSGMGFVNSGTLSRNPAACSQMSTQEDWRHTADCECLCPLFWTHAGVCPAPGGLCPLAEQCSTAQRSGWPTSGAECVLSESARRRGASHVLPVSVFGWRWIYTGPHLFCVSCLPISRYLLGKLPAEMEILVNAGQNRAGCAQEISPRVASSSELMSRL